MLSAANASEFLLPKSLESFERYGIFQYYPSTPHTLYLLEEIQPNQALEFRKALQDNNISLLVLASPGGSVESGLLIADKVHDKNIDTLIPSGEICASACSYIFLAGKNRVAGEDAGLGVHQFAPSVSEKVESEEIYKRAQELMGSVYRTVESFDVPSLVVSKMLSTPPEEMYFFRSDQMRSIERGEIDPSVLEVTSKLLNDRDKVLKYLRERNNSESKEVPSPVPTEDSGIDQSQIVKQIQTILNSKGCSAGPVDGVFGPSTIKAIQRYEAISGNQYDGELIELLVMLAGDDKFQCPVASKPKQIELSNDLKFSLFESCTHLIPSQTISGQLYISEWVKNDREITYKALLKNKSDSWVGTVSAQTGEPYLVSLNMIPRIQNADRRELNYLGKFDSEFSKASATRGKCTISLNDQMPSNESVLNNVRSPDKWGIVALKPSLKGSWLYTEECSGVSRQAVLNLRLSKEQNEQNDVVYDVTTSEVLNSGNTPSTTIYDRGLLIEDYDGYITLEFFPTTTVRQGYLNSTRDKAYLGDKECYNSYEFIE